MGTNYLRIVIALGAAIAALSSTIGAQAEQDCDQLREQVQQLIKQGLASPAALDAIECASSNPQPSDSAVQVTFQKVTLANGDIYEGGWLDGKPHGQGVMNYANGSRYNGDWLNGEFHGIE